MPGLIETDIARQLHVIVVGAGLCGLSMAISMSLAGHRVSVYEAHDKVDEIGAGLQSSPNGVRIYEAWGMIDHMKKIATSPELLQISRFDGRLLAQRKSYDAEVHSKYGLPLWTLHRVDLQQALFARAKELGAEIIYNAKVADINCEQTYIELEGGEEAHADMIVVADGVWSKLRSVVLEEQIDAQPTGDMAYRLTIDPSTIDDKGILEWADQSRIQLWIGPGSHVIGYPVRSGSKINLVLLAPDNFKGEESRIKGCLDELRMRFKGWDPLLNKALDHVEKVDKWRLMHVPKLNTWRHKSGTVVLAGDSCHAILPYTAQGLNMALEDAATLGTLMRHAETPGQIASVTTLYEKLRICRTARLLDETASQGVEFHLTDGEMQEKRDLRYSDSFREDTDWYYPRGQPWIWSYDAIQEAEKAFMSNPY